MASLTYCGELVRRHDPDRFLLSLYEPAERREALFALYAFNHEIAKTRELVTETQLGLIRLQWWRDALAACYGGGEVPKHQVLEPLCTAIRTHGLPREDFDALIYAREFDLEDRLPATLSGTVKYAEYTNAPLARLALEILGQAAAPAHIQAAAAAYGLAGILRAVPLHLRQRRCYLPEDLIQYQEMSVYDLYDGSAIDKLPLVAGAVAAEAARHALNASGASSMHLRRMAKLSRLYLAQMKGAGFDVFSPKLSVPPLLRELRLLFR